MIILLAYFAALNAQAANSNALSLQLQQQRYVGGPIGVTQGANYTQFSAGLNLSTESTDFTYGLSALGQGTLEAENEFYFGMPELFLKPRKLGPGLDVTVGRQKRQWSRLDEEFNLGVWQPQLRWDYLAPIQQGLTGVFFDWSLNPYHRITFFTSPIAIPDQGPQYTHKDGKFTSSNRWFAQPHPQVHIFSGTPAASDAPLYYEIDKPNLEDIVMHSSFGLSYSFYGRGPFWTQFSYAYKPRNQIHLGIECANCGQIVGGGPIEVTAVIHPKIVKHHVMTWEVGFDRVDDSGWLSLTGDFSNASGFPSGYFEGSLHDLVMAGAAYQHYVGEWMGKPSWLQYSYVRTLTVGARPTGNLIDRDQVQSSMDRYQFPSLAAIEWKLLISQQSRNRWHWRNRYSYAFFEKGGWWSSFLELDQGDFNFYVGLDILGSQEEPSSSDAGLFSRYRANDRIFGGVGYVF